MSTARKWPWLARCRVLGIEWPSGAIQLTARLLWAFLGQERAIDFTGVREAWPGAIVGFREMTPAQRQPKMRP